MEHEGPKANMNGGTVPYESSMGVSITPITPRSAISMRRMELQEKPFQGRARSAIRMAEMLSTSITLAIRTDFHKDCKD
jgi:hypothetical protein